MHTTVSSHEFNRDTSGAKKQRFLDRFLLQTEVNLPMCCYPLRISNGCLGGISVVDRLAMADAEQIDFEPPQAVIRSR